ncbi:hypothetical protein RJ640_029223 [Escallonia rubra]|uniref:Serine-threonine/tyrosine-protein kinase catalytic domain-containing protein n=1 Tax=Escallonia rubra TaxID=112253 RepID=A0AA88QKW5_9ASTE|nr:hypothetical protein RJ640_029223 [Escallonia rubra]
MAPKPYTIHQLKSWSKDFSTKIGSGGFLDVFSGIIKDDDVEVALKVYKENEKKMEKELLSKVTHRIIVKLIGYGEGEQKYVLVLDKLAQTLTHATADER